jgi:hypothetical protein
MRDQLKLHFVIENTYLGSSADLFCTWNRQQLKGSATIELPGAPLIPVGTRSAL